MKIKNIVDYTKEIAPFETAAEWDNIGLLVGDENADVMRVLLALDITNEVVKEAREKGCGLIISHHPVIFDPLRALAPADPVYSLAKNDIAALCLHTNLDRAERGVNTALAEALGLKNITLYPDCYLAAGDTDREYGTDEYAALIKERLGAPSVRYTDGKVSRVAVSSGGGGEGVELSAEYGFDAFVTGELKHHQYIAAIERGTAAFDAGHFSTEDVIIKPLADMLKERFSDTDFIISEKCRCPYKAV